MKITIIIVVKNAVRTIERCINSIFKQNYHDTELVIIDGQSTDGTLNILKKYVKNIDVLISEPDGGIYDAMNKGIRNANGDVIAFLNSDDWYCDGVLKRVEEIFKKDDNIGMVYGDALHEDKNGTYKTVAGNNFMNTLLDFYVCHQCVFAKKCVFDTIGVFDTRYQSAADYDWMLKLALSDYPAIHDNAFYAHYSLGGMSEQYAEKHAMEAWDSSKRHLNDAALLKAAEKRYHINLAKVFWKEAQLQHNGEAYARFINTLRREKFDRDIIIYGAGQFGRELRHLLDNSNVTVRLFIDRDYKEIERVENLPVISFKEYLQKYKEYRIIISPVRYKEIEEMFVAAGLHKSKDYVVLIELLMEFADIERGFL